MRLHLLLSLCSVWVSFDDCHYAAFMALHVIGAKCLGFVVVGGMWRMCSKIFTAFQIGSYCEWARGGKGPGLITIVNQESVRYTQKKKKGHVIRGPMLRHNMVTVGQYKYIPVT